MQHNILQKNRLIDKSTGDVVASAGETFTPNKASGSVKVTFTFNGKKYEETSPGRYREV